MVYEVNFCKVQLVCKSLVSNTFLKKLARKRIIQIYSRRLHWVTFPTIQIDNTLELSSLLSSSSSSSSSSSYTPERIYEYPKRYDSEPENYYVGCMKRQYPILARNNLIRFYNACFYNNLTVDMFRFTSDIMQSYHIPASSLLDYYPFPRTFKSYNSSNNITDDDDDDDDNNNNNNKNNNNLKLLQWKQEYSKYSQDKYSLTHELPVLTRTLTSSTFSKSSLSSSSSSITQEAMIWPDFHCDLGHIDTLQKICNSYQPDIIMIEMPPNDDVIVPMLKSPLMSSIFIQLLQAANTPLQIFNNITRQSVGEWLLRLPTSLVGSSLHAAGPLPLLKYIAMHKTPVVALDMANELHLSFHTLAVLLDMYHSSICEELLRIHRNSAFNKNQSPNTMELNWDMNDERNVTPHYSMLRNYRSNYFAIGINECDPIKFKKILVLMGAHHVPEVIQRLTKKWPLSNPFYEIIGNQVLLRWDGLDELSFPQKLQFK